MPCVPAVYEMYTKPTKSSCSAGANASPFAPRGHHKRTSHGGRPSFRAVERAEEAVPPDTDHVDEQQAVLQRDQGKVEGLDGGPNQPVGRQRGPVALFKLGLGAGALEGGHGGEEDTNHDGGEDELVGGDAANGGGGGAAEVDVAREEAEPGRGDGAEDT